ncbi:MAG TPA: LPXTG cell wall anchor domain-containing protein [Prolixibacteraceae bacterium]|jgi:LPXTG-motif cell wall-anchored protein
MKKLIMFALLGLLFIGGPSAVFAQGEDSTDVSLDEPKDTISIDKMDPTFYEEETPAESSNTMTYAIIGGIVVIGGAAFYFMKKKKK